MSLPAPARRPRSRMHRRSLAAALLLTAALAGARPKVVSRAVVEQAYVGLCFAPDGRHLYASGGEFEVVHAFDFQGGYLSNPRPIPVADPKGKFVVTGITVSPDGKM